MLTLAPDKRIFKICTFVFKKNSPTLHDNYKQKNQAIKMRHSLYQHTPIYPNIFQHNSIYTNIHKLTKTYTIMSDQVPSLIQNFTDPICSLNQEPNRQSMASIWPYMCSSFKIHSIVSPFQAHSIIVNFTVLICSVRPEPIRQKMASILLNMCTN